MCCVLAGETEAGKKEKLPTLREEDANASQ